MRQLVAGFVSALAVGIGPAMAAEGAPASAESKPPEAKAGEALPELKAEEKPAEAAKPEEKKQDPATPAPTPTDANAPVSGANPQAATPAVGESAATGTPVKVESIDALQPVKAPAIGDPPPLAAPATAAAPVEDDALPFRYEFHGFVRAGYTWVMRDPSSFSVGQNSGFRLQNARFGLQGGYGSHVTFDLSLDAFSSNLDGNTNQAPLAIGLRDANVAFDFGVASLKVGQFKTPFNGEFLLPDDQVPFSRVSLVTDGVRGDESRTPYGALMLDRELGVSLGTRLPLGEAAADLEIAAVNGNGINQGRNDNNLPALVGRAAFGWRGSTLAVSGLWNDRTAGRLGNLQDERDLGFDVDLSLNLFGARLFGMYVAQQTQYLTAADQLPKKAYGVVGSVAYPFEVAGSRLEPAYRIAVFSSTNLIPEAGLLDQTFGVNVYPGDLPVRVQAGYTWRVERVLRTAPNDLAEVLVQANY